MDGGTFDRGDGGEGALRFKDCGSDIGEAGELGGGGRMVVQGGEGCAEFCEDGRVSEVEVEREGEEGGGCVAACYQEGDELVF